MSWTSTDERTRERWRLTLELFEQSAELSLSEREKFLHNACGADAALRQGVQEMLHASAAAEASGFLEKPSWTYAPPDSNPRALVGKQAGAYRLTQFLDRGGMGEVYLAERNDGLFERRAAVKLMRADLSARQFRRFRREARILASLKHPNLVFLYDAGRMPDGRPYLVMEYVAGDNLRVWQEQRGALPRAQVGEIARQACAALQVAHDAGVIHRDIKPSNIIVAEQDDQLTVKVLDFGVAAQNDTASTNTSMTEGVVGTVAYMSPEQLQGASREQLTPAADLYALGLVVYELLTGQRAINGYSQGEIVAKHLHHLPTPPSQLRPDLQLPAAVDRVLLKVLAKAPGERYQTAQQFAQDLTAALRETPVKTLPTQPVPQPQPAPQPQPQPAPQPQPTLQATPPGNFKLLAALLLLLVFLGGVSLALYWLWPRPEQPPRPEQITVAQPASSAGLRVLVTIKDSAGRPLPNSRFELFQAGLSAVPAPGAPNKPLCDKTTDAAGETTCGALRVTEGEYPLRVSQSGYQTVAEIHRLTKNPTLPDAVWLVISLKKR